jgi:hypothetical protein
LKAGLRWLSDDVNFIKREAFKKVVDGLLGKPEGRLDPKDMIAKMVEVIPSREGKFLNIFPPSSEDWVKSYQQQLYDRNNLTKRLLVNDDDRPLVIVRRTWM